MNNQPPIQPPAFQDDGVNVVHLGSNFYALKFPRSERVVLAAVNKLRDQHGITAATEFKKEGLAKKGSERIGSSPDMRRFPAIPKALRLRGLEPMDYILIRFGPKPAE